MFIGECKLYIINKSVPNDADGKKQDLIYLTNNNEITNWDPNSLILNIGEEPNKFYTVDNKGNIKIVNLFDNNIKG